MRLRPTLISLLPLALLSISWPTEAQPVVSGTERIASDRPEAWAVKYYTSTTLLGGFTVPDRIEPGSLVVGGEFVWIPFLSLDQRRVGFGGTKVEDLNKAPFFPRPRITVGLPADFAATVAFMPPIKTFGVTPRIVGVALERPIHASETWAVGWRVYAQGGTAKAAFTCWEEAVASVPGTPGNPTGCLAPSSDVATLRYVGVELGVGHLPSGRRLAPHLAVALNYLDNEFEVNARRFDRLGGERVVFVDRTRQTSEGLTVSITGGVGFPLSERLDAAIDVFYTPLWVRRTAAAPQQNDGLLNAKALIRYRLF